MNAYLVRIPEERSAYAYGNYEPPEPWWPTGVFIAETRGRAKVLALTNWTSRSTGVETDDFNSLRTNLLARDVDLLNPDVRRGEYETGPLFNFLWLRVHEVLDHGGARCTCPEYLEDEAAG